MLRVKRSNHAACAPHGLTLQEGGKLALLPVAADLGPAANLGPPAVDQPDDFEHISHAGGVLCSSVRFCRLTERSRWRQVLVERQRRG